MPFAIRHQRLLGKVLVFVAGPAGALPSGSKYLSRVLGGSGGLSK